MVVLGLQAQTAGHRLFPFLDIPVGARGMATATLPVPFWDYPVDRISRQPALTERTPSRSLFIGTDFYWARGAYYHLAYVHRFRRSGKYGFFLNYYDYGEFEGRDARGNLTAPFRGGESEVGVSKAFRWWRFTFGGAVKWTHTDLLSHSEDGLVGDFSLMYASSDSLFTVTVAANALGTSLRSSALLPLNVSWAAAYKFRHNPLRLYGGMHHLQMWRFSAFEEETPIRNIDDTTRPSALLQWVATVFRHVGAGAELILSEGLRLRMGYHVQRRQELSLFGLRRMTGFSFGLSVKVRGWYVDYTYVPVQSGNPWHALGLRADLRPLWPRRGAVRKVRF